MPAWVKQQLLKYRIIQKNILFPKDSSIETLLRLITEKNMNTNNQIFIDACNMRPVKRTPIWIMRQAGRYLPEYREIRTKASFHTMMHTPELMAEVTLLPIKRYSLDAAIMFSDILVVPE